MSLVKAIALVCGLTLPSIALALNDTTQKTTGWCSPAVHDVGGNVTVNCHGVNPKVVARLEELLDKKDIEVSQYQQIIDQWIARYHALQQQLAQRQDEDALARQAKAALDEGDLEKAEGLLQRSLAGHLENLAKFQARAAQDAHSLGNIAELQLAYRKAQQYFEQAAKLAPENSTYLNNAGVINHTLGLYKPATTYFEQALDSDLKTYGQDHPKVAIRRNNLGSAYKALGEYDKAIRCFEQALATFEQRLGKDHRYTKGTQANLAAARHTKGTQANIAAVS